MKKVVFLGGRRLGFQVLKWLKEKSNNIEVVGACLLPREFDLGIADSILTYTQQSGIPTIQYENLLDVTADMFLSVNFNRLIPASLIQSKNCFYNVHHSYNLRLRGRNITTQAILLARKENIWYHGTTLHRMAPELDAGGVVASYSVPIKQDDTAFDLFNRTDDMAFHMLQDWIPRILFEQVLTYSPPVEGVHEFKAKDIPAKQIPNNIHLIEVHDYVRALDFPGYEPAYVLQGGIKKHLVLKKRDTFCMPIEYEGNRFYTELEDKRVVKMQSID